MAKINNPKKQFNFAVYAPGLNNYAVQTANIPGYEIDATEHGDTNYKVKTPGMINFENITLEKLRPMDVADNWVHDWVNETADAFTGANGLPGSIKRNITIVQLASDNITVTDQWEVEGAWPVRVNGMNLSRVSSDNSMETVELSVDRVRKVR